jgi:tetratricopeptide (TPR) repeat protein
MMTSSVDPIRRLGPRSLAAVIRRSVLPIEIWLGEGEYRPFIDAFASACDAAAPWYALGHDPGSVRPLAIDAVYRRGSFEERQAWSPIWSAARTIEFARLGNLYDAYGQFEHTVELIADWPETLAELSRDIRQQISVAVEHVAEITSGMKDPPVDDDTLMIPAFYVGASGKLPVTYKANAKPRSFDAEIEELIQMIKAGKVAIFCGAGISIASGIPAAKALQRAVLNKLPASELETTRLVENDLPFEAFMEVLSKATNFEALLDVFAGREPTAAHILLADLDALGSVPTIATTNFDELIERAGGSTPVAVTKLHGTISNPRSIAVTMEAVAARRQLPDREQAIRDLFADGDHAAVLVIGYSCSDAFDITPAIEALGDSLKRIWIVEHGPHSESAEDIVDKPWKNPFRRCRKGTRLFCDTDVLLARIARELTRPEYISAAFTGNEGLGFIDKWWSQVTPRAQLAAGHLILGQLWYLCGDFRAAKSHYRVWMGLVSPRQFTDAVSDEHFQALLHAGWPREGLARRCHALLQIAGCHRALSEYNRVLDRGREAYRIARLLGDQFLKAEAAGTMGNAWFNMGEVAKAIEWYERHVGLLRELGNQQRRLGSALANLGNAFGARGDLEKALESFREGVELARDLGDKIGEGSRLGGTGQVLGKFKRWKEAEAAHLESLNIARAMADLPGIAIQLARLANVESERRRFDEAIKKATEAATLYSEFGDRQGEARVLGNLGGYYLNVGKIADAKACFLHSEEIAAAIDDKNVLEVARRNLALIEQAADNPLRGALKFFRRLR